NAPLPRQKRKPRRETGQGLRRLGVLGVRIVALVELRPGAHDLLRYFVTARELEPVSLEATKIFANIGTSGAFGLAGAVGGMRAALFNLLGRRERHRSAFLSQFDPQTREHGARQPLR